MLDLHLDDHDTDVDRFVHLMMSLKRRAPAKYKLFAQHTLAIAGMIELDADQRAELCREIRATFDPAIAEELELQLAQGAAS